MNTLRAVRRGIGRRLAGHLWTLQPHVRDRVWRGRAPAARALTTVVHDPVAGPVRLRGYLREVPDARALVLLVHGLGGGPDAVYLRAAAKTLAAHGYASVALAMRGAGRTTGDPADDFYHVAQADDLDACLAHADLARYEHVFVLGFSIGGHVALHLARAPRDPRVRAVAAVCSPIDLAAAQRHLDAPRAAFYRRHVLRGLKAGYAAVAAHRGAASPVVPSPAAAVAAVRTIHAWDTLAIAPRYGFASPEHFYATMSVAPHLPTLAVPSLLVLAVDDPLVPRDVVEPFLPGTDGGALAVHWTASGGHVAFPRSLDLGLGPRLGLIGQLTSWFEARTHG